jgi:4-azaleucine resistance transporter AzlC
MASRPPRTLSSGWRGGLQLGLALAVGSFALAVSFGAFAVSNGWPAWIVILMSAVVFSGSAQFALVTAMAGGGSLTAGITAAALINARFIPMAAATARYLKGGWFRRALEGQGVVDASFVGAQRGDGTLDRQKMLGATLIQWPVWIAGTAIGAIFAPSTQFMKDFGLDVVFPAFFLLLLLDTLRSRPDLLPVTLIAAAIAAGALLVLPGGVSLVVCAVAALLGAFRATRAPREPDEPQEALP